MKRREFIASITAVTVASTLAVKGFPNIIKNRADAFTLPPLPFSDNALAPVISSNTIGFHYGKHHKGYATNLNKLVDKTPFAEMSVEQIILKTANDKTKTSLFNNAAQFWNHTFYWNSLKPNGGGQPTGKMLDAINKSFTNFDGFKKQLADASTSQFGSGWAWLVADKKGMLKVINTPNAVNPLPMKLTPILTIDVWEHAYYLDYQNKRGDYANAVIDKLLNWEFAAKNLG